MPSRHLLRTEEQLAGIRESARINTALLDYISENIREGMSTAEIDHMVYCFTTDHDAIPAPFLYDASALTMWCATASPAQRNSCAAEIL